MTLREHPGTTVVTDSVTSNGLTDFITALGGKHLRCVHVCVWVCVCVCACVLVRVCVRVCVCEPQV